ncbi:MAG: hypothetical protein ACNFW9_03645 [Candidatus Kerfeldbacteria bacterium]
MSNHAVMNFGVPQIFISRYCDTDDSSLAMPILLMCNDSQQCDFLNSQIITGSTNMVHLNIDLSVPRCAQIAIYLECFRKEGFLFTPADLEIIRCISNAETAPYLDYSIPLTSVIIGAVFDTESELAESLIDNRENVGHFELTAGFMEDASSKFLSSDQPSFLRFSEYSTISSNEFVGSVLQSSDIVS